MWNRADEPALEIESTIKNIRLRGSTSEKSGTLPYLFNCLNSKRREAPYRKASRRFFIWY
jgi:hypothetical protein